jgi:hypothetical protein
MMPAPPPPTRPPPGPPGPLSLPLASTVDDNSIVDEENDLLPLPLPRQPPSTPIGRHGATGGDNSSGAMPRVVRPLNMSKIGNRSSSLRSPAASNNPAWQVIKHVKRMSSTKLTHLVLRLLTTEKVLSLDRQAPLDDSRPASPSPGGGSGSISGGISGSRGGSHIGNDSPQNSKYPRELPIANLHTVVRASNRNMLSFRSSSTDKTMSLEFHNSESSDICCRLLYAANKDIQFLDEGETWLTPGKVVEYEVQAGRRQGSVTTRVGAAFTSSRVVLRLNVMKRQLMLVWPSKRKRYNVPAVMEIKENWTVQCNFSGAHTKATIMVPSFEHSSGLIVMEFYFPSPALKLRFCGHVRVAMLADVGIAQLRRTGLALSGVRGPQLRVWCGTWNCGETQSPGPVELSKWIDVENSHDVYAIAFQECDDKTAFVTDCKAVFVGRSRNAMDEVAFVSLWGIHLLVLMRRDKSRFVTNVRTDKVACGVANLLGNKGAVGCAFCYNGSTEMAFIGSHLAALAKRMEERRNDF